MSRSWQKREKPVSPFLPPPDIQHNNRECDNCLLTQGQIGNEPCLVTTDTSVSVTTVRPDLAAVGPKRKPRRHYLLKRVSKEALSILKEALVEPTLEWSPTHIWVLMAEIMIPYPAHL
jgi:hypothetical protein